MLIKRIVASVIASVMIVGTTQVAYAAEVESPEAPEMTITIDSSISSEDTTEVTTPALDDLAVQLNDMYVEVGRNLNIDYIYVKILHLLAGGKAVYADKLPNIYSETTVESMQGPFDIEGATQTYSVQAPWIVCPDEEIERPSKYYIVDAAYSTTSDIVKLMNQRYFADRGQMQDYFDALSKEVKTNIVFCEAVMEYIGSDREAIESFYSIYEKILYEKETGENVIEANGDGTFSIKDKFKQIFISNNITSERDLEVLCLILSFDSKLAASSSPDEVKDEYVAPYKIDYTSRENMMLAAMSVVGKVRYVWGGGHLDTGTLNGINPAWQAFYEAYPTEPEDEGFSRCIQPTGCWCPIHGAVEAENGCLMSAETVYSVEEYIDSRKEVIDTSELDTEIYKNLLNSDIDFSRGVNSHRLDGFDCSGYASWVYNQISSTRTYDCGARNFISAGGLRSIAYGSEMLPGDVFSWGSHIVVVVGAVRDGSKAYVILEASPNTVKFGVMYYGSARQSDINTAINVAREANDLIGGLPLTEKTHIYNMDSVGFSENEPTGRYAEIGRLPYSFLDENIIIAEYGKKIKDMTAQEIIQYTLNNINEKYVTGLNTYTGSIYDVSTFKSVSIDAKVMASNEQAMQSVLESTEVESLVDGLVKE